MALCDVNSLSNVFRPRSSSTPTEVAIHGNTNELFRIACASPAHKPCKWRIGGDIASSRAPSKLHHALCLNALSKSFVGELPVGYEQKIQEVRQYLLQLKGEDDPTQSLLVVDVTQRLGVSQYFEEEIESILSEIYAAKRDQFQSLHDVSLYFRLWRQHGGQYYISADVFNNFKDKDGRFKAELEQDISGLMELHEAAQLGFEGEFILDDAANFSSHILNNSLLHMDDYTRSRIVGNKLRHPSHKSIARLTDRSFHDDLGGMYEPGKTLREIAVMDLHMGQSVYQEELIKVSRWLNDLGLHKELTLARNQPFEWYMGSMVILIDYIGMSGQRIELTKSITFIYLLDDIFDVYGTPDELIIFTEAVKKWNYAAIDTLPDYMKMSYRALLDTTNEMGHTIYKKHGFNPINSLKATWVSLCNSYLVETEWFGSKDSPRAEEYLENGKVSSGVYVVLVHLFFLLGLGGSTDEGAIHLDDILELVSSVAKIFRLWNDLGSAKDKHQNGKVGSYIECYRKEHENLSTAQARQHAIDMVAVEWKRLNKTCFNLNSRATSSFKRAALNLARMVPLMYNYNDQWHPTLEEHVKFMMFNETNSSSIKKRND